MGKTALLIIDMQNDFCLQGAPFEVKGALNVAKKIKQALEACRKHGLPVIYVFRNYLADGSDVEITRYDSFIKTGGGLISGTKGAEIVEELAPLTGEHLLTKKRWSAFFQTELDALLKKLDIDQIIVTGVQTPNCIRSTVWDANSLDYEIIVLSDGTGSQTLEIQEANLLDMQNIGVKIMSTEDFIKCLPNVPKDNLVHKIKSQQV